MSRSAALDVLDHAILELLRLDARRSMKDIADRVNLSAAAVGRRIERLERSGVIVGYTTVVHDDAISGTLDAFTELSFSGDTHVNEIIGTAARLPEVLEAYTTTGSPDALVRMRVEDPSHLKRVIGELRKSGGVTGTKTLIIVDRWSRHHRRADGTS